MSLVMLIVVILFLKLCRERICNVSWNADTQAATFHQ